jgi:hypothetical protein
VTAVDTICNCCQVYLHTQFTICAGWAVVQQAVPQQTNRCSDSNYE